MPRCQNPRRASGSIASEEEEEEAPPPLNASPRDYCPDIPTRLVRSFLRRRIALNSFFSFSSFLFLEERIQHD